MSFRIKRPGLLKTNAEVYEFSTIPNVAGTHIHIYLDRYFVTCRKKMIDSSPRWVRNNPASSTIPGVEVPQDVLDEVRSLLINNMTFHLTNSGDCGIIEETKEKMA